MKETAVTVIMFAIGIGCFVLGAYLVSELFLKFLKFFIGFILIILSLQLMFGTLNAYVWRRKFRPPIQKVN
jgi:uncharacterized membrane protein YfcA